MNTLEEAKEILYVPSIIAGVKTRGIREAWKKCVQFKGLFSERALFFPV